MLSGKTIFALSPCREGSIRADSAGHFFTGDGGTTLILSAAGKFAGTVVGRRMAGVLPEVAGNEGEDLALAERDPPDHRLVFPVPLLSLLENAAARMCMSFAGPRWP